MNIKDWEYIPCNFCREDTYKVLYNDLTYWEYPGKFRIVECASCKLIYLNPRPTIKNIEKYYQQENYYGRDISNNKESYEDSKIRDESYNPIYKYILKFKKSGNILDIGAGTGLFLSKLKEDGWNTEGIEINRDAVTYAKKKYNISLRKGDFFDFKLKNNFYDVITLNGALEHIYKPKETLERIYSLLKIGGIIIFSVPNVKSIGRNLYGKYWFPWQPPRHLYHYSPEILRKVLEQMGYQDIKFNFDYFVQNQYILFNSFRFAKSPKFQKNRVSVDNISTINPKNTFSIKKEIGKIIVLIFSIIIAKIEPIIRRGEVMIVYAKK